jgi:hypothetical protein
VTVSGNDASDSGGGLYNPASATLNLSNVTLGPNSALSGGNILNSGTANLINTIIDAALAGGNCTSGGTYNDQGYNLENAPTSTCGVANTGDPQLGPLQKNGGRTRTHALGTDSEALDAGDLCEPTDQRGIPRPQGSACDIGAYERALCFGRAVNRVGTPGPDRMNGTAANEVFATLEGGDSVNPRGGADRVCLGRGNDTVDLRDGSGNDRAEGGPGTDRAFRDPGDILSGF